MTPYQYAGDDPVLLIDLHGDSVGVDKSITANKQANKDFNLFANSKAGRKFLSQYAAKGQTIAGYTFKKSGKYNDKGVDVTYKIGNTKQAGLFGETKNNTDAIGVPVGGRLKESVSLDYLNSKETGNDLSMQITETIFHESFIHVDLDTKDYLDDGRLNQSNLSPESIRNAAFEGGSVGDQQHLQIGVDFRRNGYNTLFPGQAFDALKSINQQLQTNYSVQKILGLLESGL